MSLSSESFSTRLANAKFSILGEVACESLEAATVLNESFARKAADCYRELCSALEMHFFPPTAWISSTKIQDVLKLDKLEKSYE